MTKGAVTSDVALPKKKEEEEPKVSSSKKEERLTAVISQSTNECLDEIAIEAGISKSEALRSAIKAGLVKFARSLKTKRRKIVERIREFAGEKILEFVYSDTGERVEKSQVLLSNELMKEKSMEDAERLAKPKTFQELFGVGRGINDSPTGYFDNESGRWIETGYKGKRCRYHGVWNYDTNSLDDA
jgi:hypothetical protein